MTNDFSIEIRVDRHDMDLVMNRVALCLTNERVSEFLDTEAIPYLHERVQRRFEGEGDDVVGKWLPLREATVKRREMLGYSGARPINQRTRDMIQYLTRSHSIQTSGVAVVARIPGEDPTGEMLEKIMTAQKGRDDPATKARPVLGINPADAEAIVAEMQTWIAAQIAA